MSPSPLGAARGLFARGRASSVRRLDPDQFLRPASQIQDLSGSSAIVSPEVVKVPDCVRAADFRCVLDGDGIGI